MKDLLRRLLWFLFRRDVLVLNPEWKLLHRGSDLILAGTKHWDAEKTLPVSYSFHVSAPWRLIYRVYGEGAGSLSFTVRAADGHVIGEGETNMTLPGTLELEEREGALYHGSQRLGAIPEPRGGWLLVDFALDGRKRRVAHHVLPSAASDAAYFTGAVYADYEQNPGFDSEHLLDTLSRHRPLEGRFLDLGCATGHLVAAALRRGLEADGVDVSAWAVERANARTGNRCRVVDLDRATAADFQARYDLITLHSVIEHCTQPTSVLNLIHALLRPGGVAFIQTLNADSLMHRLQKENWSGFSDPTHRSPWLTSNWLCETSTQLGFAIVAVRTSGLWNDNRDDQTWRAFAELLQCSPVSTLLEEGLGDFVEIVLRKP